MRFSKYILRNTYITFSYVYVGQLVPKCMNFVINFQPNYFFGAMPDCIGICYRKDQYGIQNYKICICYI